MKQLVNKRKKMMQVPNGYTEEQVLAIIDNVVNKLGPSFTFAHFDTDDIKQEGRIIALDILQKNVYDTSKPLENFLYSHVRNRLINLKRDKFARHEPPCTSCPFYDPKNLKSNNQCSAYTDKMECDRYELFIRYNTARRNINQPTDIDTVDGDRERSMHKNDETISESENNELLDLINTKLPIELRGDFLRIINGTSIPKNRRERVQTAIRSILDARK